MRDDVQVQYMHALHSDSTVQYTSGSGPAWSMYIFHLLFVLYDKTSSRLAQILHMHIYIPGDCRPWSSKAGGNGLDM